MRKRNISIVLLILLLGTIMVIRMVYKDFDVDIETYELPTVNDRDSFALSIVIDDGGLDFNDFIVSDGDTVIINAKGYSSVVVLFNENSTVAYRWYTDVESRSEHFNKGTETDKFGENNDKVAFYIDDVMVGDVYTFTYEHMSDKNKPTVSFKIKFE